MIAGHITSSIVKLHYMTLFYFDFSYPNLCTARTSTCGLRQARLLSVQPWFVLYPTLSPHALHWVSTIPNKTSISKVLNSSHRKHNVRSTTPNRLLLAQRPTRGIYTREAFSKHTNQAGPWLGLGLVFRIGVVGVVAAVCRS